MTTVGDIAISMRGAKQRLEQMFTSYNWNKDQSMTQIFGFSGFPMSCNNVSKYMEMVATRVEKLTKAELEREGLGVFLGSIHSQIDELQFNSINQGNNNQVSSALIVFQLVNTAIPTPIPQKPKIDWEDLKDQKDILPKDLARRLRSVGARLEQLEPKSTEIEQKISEIELAHATAEQLPTDLEELASHRNELRAIIENATKLANSIEVTNERVEINEKSINEFIAESKSKIEDLESKAGNMIVRSEQALRGTTSAGLAKAFAARKESLTQAGIYWTFGLLLALLAALFIGWERVSGLKDVLVSDRSATVIWVNALLAAFGVGAPVWFAWLSTKQIAVNFRLAEDYAFKATVSQAYEGYRAEAVQIDPALQQRLFASALTRIEEAPIRLMDIETHGTPLQELLNNPAIRKGLEGVPDIANKIIALIPNKGGAAIVAPVAAAVAVAASANDDEPDDKVA